MKALLACAVVLILVTVSAGAVPLTILYTNDLHARTERFDGLAERIAAERASGVPVLLLDAGDAWQDFRVPRLAVWGATETARFMTDVGYDAMALGNHELYLGANHLAETAGQAGFPLLCANLRPCAGIAPPFVPSVERTVGGLRVLLIGLVTGDGLPYADYPWLVYEPPEVALARILETAPAGIDLTIVLAHLSLSDSVRLAAAVPGVDVFVTGHSHSTTVEPIRVGKALIVQAGAFGRYLGRLRLAIDPATGAITFLDNALLATKKTPVAFDRGTVMLLALIALLVGLVALAAQNW